MEHQNSRYYTAVYKICNSSSFGGVLEPSKIELTIEADNKDAAKEIAEKYKENLYEKYSSQLILENVTEKEAIKVNSEE